MGIKKNKQKADLNLISGQKHNLYCQAVDLKKEC